MPHYDPNHSCDRCLEPPTAFQDLPEDEQIFFVQMRVGDQWNGEYYHLCNACMRPYVSDLRIVDGPTEDHDNGEDLMEDYEQSDPTPTESEEADEDGDDPV